MPTYSELRGRPYVVLQNEKFSNLWRGQRTALIVPREAVNDIRAGQDILLTANICDYNEEVYPTRIVSLEDLTLAEIFNLQDDKLRALGASSGYKFARQISSTYASGGYSEDKALSVITVKPSREAGVINGLASLICDEMFERGDVDKDNIICGYRVFGDFATSSLIRNFGFEFKDAVAHEQLDPFFDWLNDVTSNHSESLEILDEDDDDDEYAGDWGDDDDNEFFDSTGEAWKEEAGYDLSSSEDSEGYDLGITFDDDAHDREQNMNMVTGITIYDHPRALAGKLKKLNVKNPDKFRALKL